MNKIFFIFFNLLILSTFAFEDVPILPHDSGVNIRYLESNLELINTDKMKKSDKVKQAKDNAAQNELPKLKLDTEQINHQRALDFTTRQHNSMPLPRF